jgi:hypothetical protein
MLVWTGPRPSPSDWLALSGMDAAYPSAQLAEQVQAYARSKARLLYLPPYRADTRIELAELMGYAPRRRGRRRVAAPHQRRHSPAGNKKPS